MNNSTDDVIQKYVHCVYKLIGRMPHRPQQSNAHDVAHARKFLEWCTLRRVDPMLIIELRFAQVAHVSAAKKRGPRLSDMRVENLVRFAQRAEASAAAESTQSETFQQAVRDLTLRPANHEQVRREYYFRQEQALCAENPLGGGYEPRSHFCPSCPQRDACGAKLNEKWGFDVVALRTGRVERLPAAVQKALRGWCGGVSI